MLNSRPFIEQVDPPRSPRETLPTMYDLPSEDPEEPGLPDEFHDLQPQLLSATLRLTNYSKSELFTGTDLNLYYDVRHPLWHKRPDWFLVLGVPRLYDGVDLRSSYVIWQEGISPFVVVELLSPGTSREDLGAYATSTREDEGQPNEASNAMPNGAIETGDITPSAENGQPERDRPPSKWEVYEQILRIPYYIVYSRYTNRLRFFRQEGARYQEQPINEQNPRVWIEEINLGLGLWHGDYDGITRDWIRWCNADGNWIPTPAERAEQEQQRAEQEQQRADRLAERLRQLGIDPDQV